MIYLDWNILDKIQKIEVLSESEKEIYTFLETYITNNNFKVPYSNAHLNDLIRGYKKNPDYIDADLNTISQICKDLCICQYWNQKEVIIHNRNVVSFFNSAIEKKLEEADSYETLFNFCDDDLTQILVDLHTQRCVLLKSMPVPTEFKSIYSTDPIFNTIYPTTKFEMNMLALCNDLYTFSINIKKDNTLYKYLKKFLNTTLQKLKNNADVRKLIKSTSELPTYLDIEKSIDDLTVKINSSKNILYDQVMNTYFKFDIKGYKTDGKFCNMIDDSLHTFYASHCDYFITNDDKCHYKAISTYKKLNIDTLVFTAEEFIIYLNEEGVSPAT